MPDRYAIVVARFYEDLAARLEAGARAVFEAEGATVEVFEVPGAYELALASGRAYKPGDQVSYYIKSTPKKVPAYEAARLATDFDPQNRDENIDYYVAKLNELVKKFGDLVPAPEQETLKL